jgi:hypothetical protein
MRSIPLAVLPSLAIVRIAAIVVSLGLWFWTQRLLAKRNPSGASSATGGAICDGIHNLTSPIHKHLLENPRHADALLAISSFVIDLLGFYLLGSAILGLSFQPFLGLLMLFALRQFCQMLCPLPCPEGMIWRSPGIPTILVTYGTCNDLFFSGHTAIAVFSAVTLAAHLGPLGIVLGAAIIIFEIATVLVLRAHYTMDVFTGAITALYVYQLSIQWAPAVNGWLGHAAGMVIQ